MGILHAIVWLLASGITATLVSGTPAIVSDSETTSTRQSDSSPVPTATPVTFNVLACFYELDSPCEGSGDCRQVEDGACFAVPEGISVGEAFQVLCKELGDSFDASIYRTADCSGGPFQAFSGATSTCASYFGLFTYEMKCIPEGELPESTEEPPTPSPSSFPSPTPEPIYLTKLDVFTLGDGNCGGTAPESLQEHGTVCYPTTSGGADAGIKFTCTSDQTFELQLYDSSTCLGSPTTGALPGNTGQCTIVEAGDFNGIVVVTCSLYLNETEVPTATTTSLASNSPGATNIPSTTSTPSPKPDDPCFPADALVGLENGEWKRMDQLAIGDRVQVGIREYSDVYFFGHKLPHGMHDFMQLSLGNGSVLELSRGHLVLANNEWVRGEDVRVGDLLKDVRIGETRSRLVPVASIQLVKRAGLYNPHTLHGDIVVNGIQASTYTDILHPKLAHLLLLPERLLYIMHRGLVLYGNQFESVTPSFVSWWSRSGMSRALFQAAS